jgi:hypothetical protein
MLYDPATDNVTEGWIKISHKYRINIRLLIEAATYRVAFVYIPPCFCRRLPCTSRPESLLQLPLASSEEFIGRPEHTRDLHRDRVQVVWRFLRLIKWLFFCNECSLVALRKLWSVSLHCRHAVQHDRALSSLLGCNMSWKEHEVSAEHFASFFRVKRKYDLKLLPTRFDHNGSGIGQ